MVDEIVWTAISPKYDGLRNSSLNKTFLRRIFIQCFAKWLKA